MRDCVTNAFREGALESILASRPMIALYTGMAKGDESTAQYSNSNEVRGTGYTPGGVKLEGGVILETERGFTLLFHSPVWQNATITARSAIIYCADDTNRAVRIIDFGRDVTSTNGPFTVKLPGAADGGVITI